MHLIDSRRHISLSRGEQSQQAPFRSVCVNEIRLQAAHQAEERDEGSKVRFRIDSSRDIYGMEADSLVAEESCGFGPSCRDKVHVMPCVDERWKDSVDVLREVRAS